MVESRIDMDDIAACFEYFGRLAGQQAGRIVDAGNPGRQQNRARTRGRLRADHALELSAAPGGLEDRPGAGRRATPS